VFSDFIFSKFSFYLKTKEEMLLPSYKASMFRGGFGYIFKQLNCVNRLSKECHGCSLQKTCAYSYIFQTTDIADIPRPYVIEVPFSEKRNYKKSEVLIFNLILFGKAIEYIPYFVFSFIELGNKGLTKANYKFSLEKVVDFEGAEVFNGKEIVSKGKVLNAQEIIKKTSIDFSKDKLEFDFVTPLRLSVRNDLITELSFEEFIKALSRRINALSKYHCAKDLNIDHISLIEQSKSVKIFFSNLTWKDWTRYSNRQKTSMEFGGLLGNIVFKGIFGLFAPYIILGSHIHIGKNCTFGLGKYNIL
jgi:hypothetical protein